MNLLLNYFFWLDYFIISADIDLWPTFFSSFLLLLLFSSAGTDESKLYKLIHAHHALSNDTTVADDMYVGECQDASKFNKSLIKGNLLMCSYSIRFVLGLSTIKQASETAKNLSAAGVVFYMDPFVIGFQLNPVPMKMPGIIIASTNDSKVLCIIHFPSYTREYLESIERTWK